MAGRPGAWTLVEIDVEAQTVFAPKAAAADLVGAPRNWLSSANIVPREDGKLDVRTVTRQFVEYREGVAKRAGRRAALESDETAALKAERLRLQNERLDLQNRATRGEMLNADMLEIAWTRTLAAFRSALEVVPRKLAAVEGVSREAERECARLIDRALRELADLEVGGGVDAGRDVIEAVDAGTTPAAGSDAESMGGPVPPPVP